MESHLSTSTANVTITNAGKTAATVTPIASSAATRLPPIKIEPFSGDIDMGAFLGAVQAVNRRRSATNNHQ